MFLNSVPRQSLLCTCALFFLTCVFPPLAVDAKPKVDCEIKLVARHPNVVTFTWEAKVEVERDHDACDLIISFQDEKGREIHSLREVLSVKAGRSTFSGHDVCDSDVWNRVTKYVVTFDCVI